MNKLIVFIAILIVAWGCTETIVETVIDEVVTDSLEAVIDSLLSVPPDTVIQTVITYAQISVSPRAVAFWDDGALLAALMGIGINVSDKDINNVSIEYTLSSDAFMADILSQSVGHFLTERPPFEYVPNDPFPYEIRYTLEPDSINFIYVGADTLRNVNRAYWHFRIIVENIIPKTAWQYGGRIER